MENNSQGGHRRVPAEDSRSRPVTAAPVHGHIPVKPASSPTFPPGSSELAPLQLGESPALSGTSWPLEKYQSRALSWQEPRLMETSTQAGIHSSLWGAFSTPERSVASDTLWLCKESPLGSSGIPACVQRSDLSLTPFPSALRFCLWHRSFLKGHKMLSSTPPTPCHYPAYL